MRALFCALLVFTLSCVETLSPDAGIDDAEIVLDDLQLQIATWNVLFFPQSAATTERAAQVVEDENWDFVALQELFEPNALSGLLNELPEFDGVAFPEPAGAALSVGIIYKRELFDFIEGGPLTELNTVSRTPMQMVLRVKNSDTTIRFIAVHMASGIEAAAESQRIIEVAAIENYARPFVESGEHVVILGDYNTSPTDARYEEVLAPFFDRPELYHVASRNLVQPDDATFLPAGVVLDQTTVSQSLVPLMTSDEVDVVRLNEQYADYQSVLSDHLPLHFELNVPQTAN